MHSVVLRPMACFGASKLIPGSCEVLVVSTSDETFTPGQMLPPRNVPDASTAIIVVAVPMSMIIWGAGYSRSAATAATTRSLPTCPAFPPAMLSPVLSPGPTTMGVLPVSFITAVRSEFRTGGTTDEMITPSISSARRS